MRYINYLFLVLSSMLFAQNNIETQYIGKTKLNGNSVFKIDNIGNTYQRDDNTIYKLSNNQEYTYNNMQLGDIYSIDVFNPFKVNLFYRDFNTVVILDNRLSEFSKINFNETKPFRNITHVSTGNDNTIWCFNQITQELELFDYRTNTSRIKTLPISGNIKQITSNYNNCWVLTEEFIYQYNYTGSLIKKIENTGYNFISESNGNLFLLKENILFFKAKYETEIQVIDLPKLLINRFFVTNETLYIYDDEFLHQYQLINK